MHRIRKKRKLVIFSLIGILLLMVGGYASFQTSLSIKGSSKVTSDWNVKITNISKGTFTGSATEAEVDGVKVDPTCSESGTPKTCDTGLTATINVDLYEVGDYAEYDITITNKGNIDAKLNDVIIDDTNSNNAVLITYSGYSKGERLFKSGTPGNSKTIHVRLAYNPEYTGQPVSSEINLTFEFTQAEAGTIPDTDTYTLTYDYQTNGGSKANETANYDVGENVDLVSHTDNDRAGYGFVGWNTNSSATTALATYQMPNSNSTLYAIYEVMVPTIDSINTTNTLTSITVVTTAHDDNFNIIKYEFSNDNGSTWIDNGTSGTYTFTGLTTGQTYHIKVRVTNGANGKTTSDTIDVIPNLPIPTFIEYISDSSTDVEITYPEECSDGTYTCTYQKNSDSLVTVDSSNLVDNKTNVEFTDIGFLIATVSDGTNMVSSSYTVTYEDREPVSGIETYETAGSAAFTAPATGDYYLQVWGAQGGTYNSSYGVGGKGGYSYGTVTLNKGDVLYIHIGGRGTYGSNSGYMAKTGGGINGGGNVGYRGGAGGGASDIRINSDSLYARVIVAGGGGGAYSYSSTYKANGGAGGGTGGGTGSYYSSSYYYFAGGGGKDNAGGSGGSNYGDTNYKGSDGEFGYGGNTGYKYNNTSYYSNGAGGGGWYGGGAAANYNGNSYYRAAGGGGGSGYVYTSSTASNYPSGCLLDSSYYLKNAGTVGGYYSFESPTGGTETGHVGDGYAKITYNIEIKVNDKTTLAVNSVTTNSASITVTPKIGLTVSKYEFSSDGGSTWIDNGTNGTYNFTGLTHNTDYTLKARITTSEGKVVGSVDTKTTTLMSPTFNDTNGTGSINSTITYVSGCGSTYTCTYRKNSDSPVTVSSNEEIVNFTSQGTLTATISDGTNTVSETHEVNENVTLSFSTSKTTNSITVTDSVSAPTGVAKYEFQVDGGSWLESSNNVYTFTGLSNSVTHTVNSRLTTNFGTVKTGTQSTITLNSITLPTYDVDFNDVDDGDVMITYPSGCGSTYTCTYTKNSELPVTVTSTTTVVHFTADGEVGASITDGTNTVANSFTIEMPKGVVDTYGPKMLVFDNGDGLYADTYEGDDTAYLYRGYQPNNYILIGSDLYRIMSIDSSGNLKVIKNEPISRIPWDLGYSTSISGITEASSTAGTRYSSDSNDYCYISDNSSYYGCKSWGSNTSTLDSSGTSNVTQMPYEAGSSTLKNLPTYNSYLNVYLNGGTYPTTNGTTNLTSWYSLNVESNIQSKIVNHLWNIGVLNGDSSFSLAQNIEQEAAYKWRGKIGLMTATDYARASSIESCSNVYSYAYGVTTTCDQNSSKRNWLYSPKYYQWTMTPYSTNGLSFPNLWQMDYYYGRLTNTRAMSSIDVRPVFYLSSDIQLLGTGTITNPYEIKLEITTDARSTLTKLGQIAKSYDTTDGDGIYENNDGGYFYRGSDPDNYIELGTDLYRVMAIDKDGNLKVIKDTPIATMPWDPGYSTNISGITNTSSTSGTRYYNSQDNYCYSSSGSSYLGCKSWGSQTSTLNSNGTLVVNQIPDEVGGTTIKTLPTYDSYLNVYLNGGTYPASGGTTTIPAWYSTNIDSSIRDKIVDHLWNVGQVVSNSNTSFKQNVAQETAYKWRGKIGLMSATDYVRASTNEACESLYNYENDSTCYNNSENHNWLYKNVYQWTMVPRSDDDWFVGWVWTAYSNGSLEDYQPRLYSYVRPVFYLSSSTSISGNGTSGSPFVAS